MSSSTDTIRQDLVSSAVKFLTDPKVQSAPLAKRIAFLESKGMTSKEIEVALQQSNQEGIGSSSSSNASAGASNNTDPPTLPPKPSGYPSSVVQQQQPGMYGYAGYPPYPFPPPPHQFQQQNWTWKDYTIGLTAAGAIAYGMTKLVQNYVLPAFNFPTSKTIEDQTKQIETCLDLSTKSLTQIEQKTAELVANMESQKEDLTSTLAALSAAITKLEEDEDTRQKELNEISTEIGQLKVLLPKVMDRAKEHQGVVMSEIQTEIRSMKSLFLGRRGPAPQTTNGSSELSQNENASTASSSTSLEKSNLVGGESLKPASGEVVQKKPSIPAWQLEAMKTASNESSQDETPSS